MDDRCLQLLSFTIALSALGNGLATMFSQGRLIQELGREGILPCSSFFASDLPFNTPMAGMFVQWLVASLYVLLPPPGDVYLFVLGCMCPPFPSLVLLPIRINPNDQ